MLSNTCAAGGKARGFPLTTRSNRIEPQPQHTWLTKGILSLVDSQAGNDLRAGWVEEMKTRLPCSLLVGLAAVCCMICVTRAAVFSIDFGSEWIKIALVKVNADHC